MRKICSLFMILIILAMAPVCVSSQLFSYTVTVNAPGVTQTDEGYVGVISEMTVSVSEGDGSIFVETWPLSEIDTQASARLAASVASELSGFDPFQYNFYYSITSSSSVIGGPSAGAILTVASVAALNGWEVDPDVMMTGMINPDGTIGPVGGIYQKAMAASEFGIKTFLVPEGQSIVSIDEESIDLKEYAPDNWGMEVKEVSDIQDAVYEFTGVEFGNFEYSGNIVIDTSFFQNDVLDELELTIQLKDEATLALSSSTIEDTIMDDLQLYLESADLRLLDAEAAIDGGNYYTAMSFIFQSRISYSYVSYAMRYLSSEDQQSEMTEIFDEAELFITDVKGQVKDQATDIRGYSSLEAFSASQERAFEAEEYFDEAKLQLVWNQQADAIYNVAFAVERARTSIFWLTISKRYSSGDTIEISQLSTDAEIILNDANLSYIYATRLMSSNSLLEDSKDLLDSAYEEFYNENYAAALFNAIESKTRASVAIELFSAGEEVVESRMNRAKELAAIAIEEQISNGITPVLSISYYEFASFFEEGGEPVTAMIYFKYSEGVANAFKFMLGSNINTGPGLVQDTGIFDGLGGALSFITGFFSGLIAVLGAFVIYRRKFYKQEDL